MQTDAGMDTGAIIAQRAIPIGPHATAASLTERLAHLGAGLVVEVLPGWLRGEITLHPQDEALATDAPPLTKALGAVDWAQPAEAIDRQVRAYTLAGRLYPLARAALRLLAVEPGSADAAAGSADAAAGSADAAAGTADAAAGSAGATPGTVVPADDGAAVVTGRGSSC